MDIFPSYIPLEDRIFTLFKATPLFSFKDVRKVFSEEEASDKTIYRALKKLETSGRIRHIHWHQKMKVFSAIGQSELPYITLKDGKTTPISLFIKSISSLYTENRDWKFLITNKMDQLPIILSWAFVIAQLEDDELTQNYKELLNRLTDAKEALTVMLGYIESLLKHPAMSGNPKYFKAVFNSNSDPAMPTPTEITEFRRWFSNQFQEKRL